MNCIGLLASSPTHPGDPPLHASDWKKEKKESNGPGTAVRRSVKEQGNTCEHLFASLQGDIIRSENNSVEEIKRTLQMRELDHNQHSVYLLHCHLTEFIREYIKSQGEK